MSDDVAGPGNPRRPVFLGPQAWEAFEGGLDPADRVEAAHVTARVLVGRARSTDDEQTHARLVTLADDHGLDAVASLWSQCAPESLPGALWRLYALRAWVHADPEGASREFDAGRRLAPVLEVVAGVAEPPGPAEVEHLVDSVLGGVAAGDLAVALERAAAFCRVVAAGRAATAADDDLAAGSRAARLVDTAAQLERAATAARAGSLD